MKPIVTAVTRRVLPVVIAMFTALHPLPAGAQVRALPNDNRVAAGTARGAELHVALDALVAMWHPDAGPGERMYAFADDGTTPRIPGPLLRVRSGTTVVASVRNALPETILVHGLHDHPVGSAQPVTLAPGERREVRFRVTTPGTYFYWATTTDSAHVKARTGPATQLSGALIVDPAEGATPDRVFVITSWNEPPDTSGPPPHVPRDMFAINGLSWPHTERFAFTAGDTVHWRWVNPASDAHPMHLHGFYFDMLSRGTWRSDTIHTAENATRAVTETLYPGGTMSLRFVPERPGAWLFHCHFALHVSQFVSFSRIPNPEDPLGPAEHDHGAAGMAGLVLALDVAPRPGEPIVRAPTAGRAIRLHATRRAGVGDAAGGERLAFVEQTGSAAPAADSIPATPQPLVLERGEPVLITILNHTRAPTSIHWHGVEVEDSYADGVPGFSGTPSAITPLIEPGDSFVAAFTPPRSGTFMFHSHANEIFQMDAGLVSPLIVVDDRAAYRPDSEALLLIAGDGVETFGATVNGATVPAPIALAQDGPTRLRVISMNADWRVRVHLESTTGELLAWRPLAKDGADLPAHRTGSVDAAVLMGPGEIADFEIPAGLGAARIVVGPQIDESWRIVVPVAPAD